MKLNLSIIVVTYNCQDYIKRFLTELSNSLVGYEDFEVLLNDNDSSDLTFKICEEFHPIFNGTFNLCRTSNIGFAKANNLLLASSRYSNVLLLNPDVFGFYDSFWSSLMKNWDFVNPLFIKLLNQDLTVQESVGDELSLLRRIRRVFGLVKNKSISEKKIEVETGIMAFTLIPKVCFDRVGLISEEYFMYGEDHDWFFRARRKGFTLMFDPALTLIHTGGGSAVSRWNNKELRQVKLNVEKMFIRQHFTGIEKMLLILMNYLQKKV